MRANIQVVHFAKPKNLEPNAFQNSLNRQTKVFVAKRFQNSPDFRNLAINLPIWQLWAGKCDISNRGPWCSGGKTAEPHAARRRVLFMALLRDLM